MKIRTLHVCLASISLYAVEGKPHLHKGPAATPLPIELNTDMIGPVDAGDNHILSSEISGKDLVFLTTALELGEVETWLGERASHAENAKIRTIGETLRANQVDENKQLIRVAASKGAPLRFHKNAPPQAAKLNAVLEKLKGERYDKVLIAQIFEVNRQCVALYEEAAHSKDQDIKQFAEQMLPAAKEKLELSGKMDGTAPPLAPASPDGNSPAENGSH